MADEPGSRRETRYGVPAADLVLYNRHYVLGYSYYFRQAKWALEIVDPENPDLPRADNFRPDYHTKQHTPTTTSLRKQIIMTKTS